MAVGLDSLVSNLPQGYDTRLGERGGHLSGGQRQRIGIARALYRRASFLLLDEATSALDDESEKLVLESLLAIRRDVTIVMITHRPRTLAVCTRVIEIAGGRVANDFSSYADYAASRPVSGVNAAPSQDGGRW